MIYLHISLTGGQSAVQSANTALSKSNNCTLEETAVLQIIQQNPRVTQKLNKHRTSTEQVEDENTIRLIQAIGHGKLSIKEIMGKMGLKHRPTFMDNYLNPAIENGFVRLLYPDSPRHPRQKYLLTVKGMISFNQLSRE